MRILRNKYGILGIALVGLLAVGCLVSGTFVIVEEFNFTADTGFYWKPVDLTGNEDWEDHKDDIDFIDAVGFEFTIMNTSGVTTTFNAMFSNETGSIDPLAPAPTSIPAGAVTVISGLTVEAGATRNVTYAESLGMISNLEALKTMVKSGRFDYYGTSTGGTEDFPFVVTNGKIIITISAGT